ncbi:hypothetical protein LSA01_12280 [Latilactobacillus sakei]|nr:hypothetical protein LSA01_12280 [Latilactobacillus sakei]
MGKREFGVTYDSRQSKPVTGGKTGLIQTAEVDCCGEVNDDALIRSKH